MRSASVTEQMTLWRQWLQQPQTLWVRRALFQVHVWTGLCMGIYVALIGISGSALVFRVELSRLFAPRPLVISASGERLNLEALKRTAERAYPDRKVGKIWEGKRQDHAVEISLARGRTRSSTASIPTPAPTWETRCRPRCACSSGCSISMRRCCSARRAAC